MSIDKPFIENIRVIEVVKVQITGPDVQPVKLLIQGLLVQPRLDRVNSEIIK